MELAAPKSLFNLGYTSALSLNYQLNYIRQMQNRKNGYKIKSQLKERKKYCSYYLKLDCIHLLLPNCRTLVRRKTRKKYFSLISLML